MFDIKDINCNKKDIFFFLIPLVFIILKWLNAIQHDVLFRYNTDARRHILLVKEILDNSHILYLPENLPGYTPALHLFVSELTIITGCDEKFIFYSISLLLVFSLLLISLIISRKYLSIPSNKLFLIPGLFALIFSVPSPYPSYIIYYFFFPFFMLVILLFITTQNKNYLLIIGLLSVLMAFTHQFSLVFFIFISTSIIWFFFNCDCKDVRSIFDVWIISSLSWTIGFAIYYSLVYTTITQNFSEIIFIYMGHLPFLNSITHVHIIALMIVYLAINAMLYVGIKKISHKRKRSCMEKSVFLEIIFTVFINIAILFLFASLCYSLVMKYFTMGLGILVPTAPPYLPAVVSYFIGMKIPLIAILSGGGIAFVGILSLLHLKKHCHEFTSSNVGNLFISFILPTLFLPLMAVIIAFITPRLNMDVESIVVMYQIAGRFPSHEILPFLILSVLFVQSIKRKNLLICFLLSLAVFAIPTIVDSTHHIDRYSSATDTAFYWLVDNTIVPEKNLRPNILGYQYESRFPKKYNINISRFLKVQIIMISNDGYYSPLIRVNDNIIYLDNIKWKPDYNSQISRDMKIYHNTEISFYHTQM